MSEPTWTTTKPTGPCACAYENPDDKQVWIGQAWRDDVGIKFRGVLYNGGYFSGYLTALPGRWFILDIPAPPKRMTPGEFVIDYIKRHYTDWRFARDDASEQMTKAVTAAIEAAKRGELEM